MLELGGPERDVKPRRRSHNLPNSRHRMELFELEARSICADLCLGGVEPPFSERNLLLEFKLDSGPVNCYNIGLEGTVAVEQLQAVDAWGCGDSCSTGFQVCKTKDSCGAHAVFCKKHGKADHQTDHARNAADDLVLALAQHRCKRLLHPEHTTGVSCGYCLHDIFGALANLPRLPDIDLGDVSLHLLPALAAYRLGSFCVRISAGC
eukprot:141909-Rhodomonas_salina.1